MLRKISNYAIGYQGLRLVCRNQILKKTTDDICVRQNDCVKDNIIQMFSLKLYQTLIVFRQSPVEREVADEFKLLNCDLAQQKLVKIEGFLSNREKTSGRSSTVRHFFFLNTRPIEYKKLSKLITGRCALQSITIKSICQINRLYHFPCRPHRYLQTVQRCPVSVHSASRHRAKRTNRSESIAGQVHAKYSRTGTIGVCDHQAIDSEDE